MTEREKTLPYGRASVTDLLSEPRPSGSVVPKQLRLSQPCSVSVLRAWKPPGSAGRKSARIVQGTKTLVTSVSNAIWMLCALLVIATLDSVPDPPAVNPGTAQCKVVQLHDCSCDAVSQLRDALNTFFPFSGSVIPSDASDPSRPSDRMVHTGVATDTSPPPNQALSLPS